MATIHDILARARKHDGFPARLLIEYETLHLEVLAEIERRDSGGAPEDFRAPARWRSESDQLRDFSGRASLSDKDVGHGRARS
jgi:hypothetical protein